MSWSLPGFSIDNAAVIEKEGGSRTVKIQGAGLSSNDEVRLVHASVATGSLAGLLDANTDDAAAGFLIGKVDAEATTPTSIRCTAHTAGAKAGDYVAVVFHTAAAGIAFSAPFPLL